MGTTLAVGPNLSAPKASGKVSLSEPSLGVTKDAPLATVRVARLPVEVVLLVVSKTTVDPPGAELLLAMLEIQPVDDEAHAAMAKLLAWAESGAIGSTQSSARAIKIIGQDDAGEVLPTTTASILQPAITKARSSPTVGASASTGHRGCHRGRRGGCILSGVSPHKYHAAGPGCRASLFTGDVPSS